MFALSGWVDAIEARNSIMPGLKQSGAWALFTLAASSGALGVGLGLVESCMVEPTSRVTVALMACSAIFAAVGDWLYRINVI
ncbi:MAG: hypothetical protein WC817_01425 [Patescibacteria group bacterium]